MADDDVEEDTAVALGTLGFDRLYIDTDRYDKILLLKEDKQYRVKESDGKLYLEREE